MWINKTGEMSLSPACLVKKKRTYPLSLFPCLHTNTTISKHITNGMNKQLKTAWNVYWWFLLLVKPLESSVILAFLFIPPMQQCSWAVNVIRGILIMWINTLYRLFSPHVFWETGQVLPPMAPYNDTSEHWWLDLYHHLERTIVRMIQVQGLHQVPQSFMCLSFNA